MPRERTVRVVPDFLGGILDSKTDSSLHPVQNEVLFCLEVVFL